MKRAGKMTDDGTNLDVLENQAPHAPSEELNQGAQAVVRTLGFLFVSLRVVIIALLMMFFFGAFFGFRNFGGFFHVDEHEQAMLFRFGRLQTVTVDGDPADVFGSGELHWRWPVPVDELKIIETQRPVIIETRHFWPATNPNQVGGAAPPSQQGLAPGRDGYLLTGDTNIMHLAWKLTYRVTNPKKYYLNFSDAPIGELEEGSLLDTRLGGAEVTVKNVLEQAVLRVVGAWTVEEVWLRARMIQDNSGTKSRRENLSQVVRDRIETMIEELDMGISVQEVNLIDIQPPQSCAQAFAAVNDAAQEYQKQRDEAKTYRTKTLADARSKKAAIIADAEAYKSRIVASAQADRKVFEEILERYRESPESVVVALYSDTLRQVLETVPEKYILHGAGRGSREIRLMLGPEARKPRATTEEE
jgi:membrane protease subunit HflK